MKIFFKNKGEIDSFRHTRTKRIHCQQTTTRNVKSFKEKEMKSESTQKNNLRTGKYVGINKIHALVFKSP